MLVNTNISVWVKHPGCRTSFEENHPIRVKIGNALTTVALSMAEANVLCDGLVDAIAKLKEEKRGNNECTLERKR